MIISLALLKCEQVKDAVSIPRRDGDYKLRIMFKKRTHA